MASEARYTKVAARKSRMPKHGKTTAVLARLSGGPRKKGAR